MNDRAAFGSVGESSKLREHGDKIGLLNIHVLRLKEE
jgi:hypothetical protein